jgi:hypothetical protein
VRSVSGSLEIRFFDGSNFGMVSEMMKITIFKIVMLLDGLGSLMIYTHDLIVLTKIKETICYWESFGLRWQKVLNKRFYHFNAS